MCGIFGVLGPTAAERDKIKIANQTLSHRGPDAEGYWYDERNLVALCHRRLSILDLSEAGAQPMHSDSGRYVVSYNGEIYNCDALKAQLRKTHWRGHSDTEVLLACVEEWGFEVALSRIEGMYAIALWDLVERRLMLARDRLGEKPLYYGRVQKDFIFSSELKPVMSLFRSQLKLRMAAVDDFFRQGCITGELCIFQGLFKLQPGHFLVVEWEKEIPFPKKYWNLKDLSSNSVKLAGHLTPEVAIQRLEEILRKAISQQMIADVPLGAFLSGGVDSSLIVALMQSESKKKVKTFCIGFSNQSHNEADYAREVAAHIGTDHQELIVTEADLLQQVSLLPKVFDEPFADSSQIPTILVSQMARRQVTVAVSGDGGDELFAGYNRHLFAQESWPKYAAIPYHLRKFLGRSLRTISPAAWESIFKMLNRFVTIGATQPQDKVFKLASALECSSMAEFYRAVSTHHWETSPVLGDVQTKLDRNVECDLQKWAILSASEMTLADASWYLPDDILVKVDRAGMSQSIETRAPFLSREVVELAYSLPMSLKIHQGQTKWILRQILKKYVPDQLINRPKMGFGVPLDSWLRGELKDWAWDLLNPKDLQAQEVLNAKVVAEKWDQHQRGLRNWHSELWDILMFLAWRKEYGC
ncbi:MAG: asparagine synthase (glutamine-hydrolyzing) [Bdellovibrionaceae bacterium]|nr:asparagine synthase (glutamine-hydrolyzing) [Pseudobdellovibrionaceae bacterium]